MAIDETLDEDVMSEKEDDVEEKTALNQRYTASQEKLMTSIDQLCQVLDIMGKLAHRIKHQVEAMPTEEKIEDKTALSSDDEATEKKGPVLH